LALLLTLCSALTAILAIYALSHYLSAAAFVFGRPGARRFEDGPIDGVTVLIPARNEGPRAVRAIRSVLDQDHRGPIHVRLLVRDEYDDAMPDLDRAFAEPRAERKGWRICVPDDGRRSVAVFFAGMDAKAAKINTILPFVETPWLAILDCDHEADPDWIRSSLVLLGERGASFVQGRRRPIDARGLFGLWDSLHQHIGCELFNVAFSRLGLTSFFTGTTAVFDSALLRRRPLGTSLTEDIDLSYALLMDGVRVAANPWSGSMEEVSPDLYSFLARRRRWASA
jgi:cellulose synthase/poly-beta-1,6-N-acetylglucosamine synthase-like glycosyltransferase